MANKEIKKSMIQQVIPAESKKGFKYTRFKLLEPGGKAHQATWMEEHHEFLAGMIVDSMVEPEEYNGEPQLKISYMKVRPEESPEEFLPHTPYDVEHMLTELLDFAKSVRDELLRKLLHKALSDPRWRRSAAATTVHHAYLGGLLEHTLNLARLVNAIAALYPRLRRDLLMTGAVLHDIGKMAEIASGINIEYTDAGQLEGHIIIGRDMVIAWMRELGFDEDRRMLVSHLILSHHGQQQYGSPKPPLCVEAQVLCDIDGLDAHMGAMFAVIDKARPGQLWSDKVKWETKYYLGDFTSTTE